MNIWDDGADNWDHMGEYNLMQWRYLEYGDLFSRYPYYLFKDESNIWEPQELKEALDQYRDEKPDMSDNEYYSQKIYVAIAGLTDEGKALWVKGAREQLSEIKKSPNEIDLEPWNDPEKIPADYIEGYGNPEEDGKVYLRKYLKG